MLGNDQKLDLAKPSSLSEISAPTLCRKFGQSLAEVWSITSSGYHITTLSCQILYNG